MTGVPTLQDGSTRIAGATSAAAPAAAADGKHKDVWVFPSGQVAVTLVNEDGDTVSGGGTSGIQYIEGDTDATIVGTAMLWEDTADTLRVPSAANPLPVEVMAGATSGTEYVEDDAAPANPAGGILMARRRDALGSEVTTDGDVVALNATEGGELYVFDSAANDTLLDIASNTQIAVQDGSGFSDDDNGVPVFGRFQTSPTTLADGEAGIIGLTTNREVKVLDAAAVSELAAIKTAVQILDNIVAGNEAQVDVVTLPALPAGTNNIGDVDVLSLPATPAGTNLIGAVSAKLATDAIMDGVTALTPKFAIIDAASSGDNTLVAAVSSKKIRVLALFLVAAGTVTARFESGAAGTALTGQMNLVANSGFTLPFNPVGWFETAATTLLNLELSGAVSVDGALVYVEV